MRIRTVPVVFGLAFALTPPAAAQSPDVPVARRIAAITSVALEEYDLGVENGRIVLRAEFDEATSFVEEARRKAGEMSPAARDIAVPVLDRIADGMKALKPAPEVGAHLEIMRRELERLLSASLDPMPAAAPSLARAAKAFQVHCMECHGPSGMGDGKKAQAQRMDPPPTNFTQRDSLTGTSPLSFYRKITVGVSGTEMPDWEKVIALDDRWGLALYVSSLRFSEAERARGDSLLRARCADCLTLLSDVSETAPLTDDSIRAILSAHITPAPADSEMVAMLAFARTAAAAEALGGDRLVEVTRTMARTKAGLDEAVTLAGDGDRVRAGERLLDAYLAFERVETPLRARDNGAAADVERAFADLRTMLATGGGSEIGRARANVDVALSVAERSLTSDTGAGVLFGQSFLIMLREGLEAILIIGALTAFLVKAGAPERKREIGGGVLAALGASGITAIILATVFREVTAQREALEGVIMLVAAAVLFSVSYWLVSKIEVKKWHAFVRDQIQKAVGSRRTWALAAVAFLAVYREGFETVLFYAALFASGGRNAGGTAAIIGGIVVGFGVLAVVYYLIQKYGVKLPLKPFFGVTSALLYVMAFSFAGQGIAELQVAGYVPATPLRWAPSMPALGIFPTTQTLMIQVVLAVAFVGALAWIFWLEPKKAPAG